MGPSIPRITRGQWKDFVKENCSDTYSLNVAYCTLWLWEYGDITRVKAEELLKAHRRELSGNQAKAILNLAFQYKPTFIDPAIKKMNQNNLRAQKEAEAAASSGPVTKKH
jgi:hypothetical protein